MKRGSTVTDQDLEQLTSVFRLLSDKTRLNILMLLGGGERNVGQMCEALNLPQPTVSHHLGLLRMNNLVGSRRNGKQVYYCLNNRSDNPDAGHMLSLAVERFRVHVAGKSGL